MSVKHGILAMLADGPKYGYQLRLEFEARTGSTWPLNVGQVYTTLARLERDGLVEGIGADEEARIRYCITEKGRAELKDWFASPVDRSSPPRDELTIKLAMAVTVPGVDYRAVLAVQRMSTMRVMQAYTKIKARSAANPDTAVDLAWYLVLESLIFNAEAEMRWLDFCERRIAARPGTRAKAETR